MQTRDEAIKWLLEQGYLAFARDWAVGESIGVTKRRVVIDAGIVAFEPAVVWIFPDRSGGWLIQRPLVPSQEIPAKELSEAVSLAVEILDGGESALRLKETK